VIDIRCMIHYSKLGLLLERKDRDNRRVPFSLKFVKLSTGDIVHVENAVCTSSHNNPKTVNIMILSSLQVRKIRMISIIEFNGSEVFL